MNRDLPAKANKIIEVLQLSDHYKKGFYWTTRGNKTYEGLEATIIDILQDDRINNNNYNPNEINTI